MTTDGDPEKPAEPAEPATVPPSAPAKPHAEATHWTQRPRALVVNFIISILGLVLTLAFFYWPTERVELTYYVHPVQTVVVRPGKGARLVTTYDGVPIVGGISAAQIAIWNAGNRPIAEQQVLKQFVLFTKNKARILEATVRQQTSAEIVQMKLDAKHAPEGKVGVSWKTLEPEDGAVVQVLYEGEPGAEVVMEGAVLGQRFPLAARPLNDTQKGESYSPPSIFGIVAERGFMLAFAAFFGLLGVGCVLNAWKFMKARAGRDAIIILLMGLGILAGVCVAAWRIVTASTGPPFAF